MTLAWIVLATGLGGVLSVLVAAALTLAVLSKVVHHLVSLSTGVLLATALLDVLPEAFSAKAPPQALFATLLAGLLFFFLLEKAELYRHSHHHEHDDPHHHHQHGFDAEQAGRGGWSVLLGDSIHNFCDGIIIAAAFLTDVHLGLVAAVAIMAHEIPQEVGNFAVLLHSGVSRRRALALNLLTSLTAVIGGVVGYFALETAVRLLPFALAVAASSLLYVAVADLIPGLHRRVDPRSSITQVLLLSLGVAVITFAERHAH